MLRRIDFDVTLPIKLNDFGAIYKNKKANLYWQTTSEIVNKGFDIERSTNGYDFANIGFVKGNNTTNTSQNYIYSDEYPPTQNQTVYYRLKQIDTNGSIEYSKIVSVKIPQLNHTTFTVYPNPLADNIITVNLKDLPKAIYQINVRNMAGLSVFKSNLVYNGDALSKTLDLNLTTGVYIIEITSAFYQQTQKLLVQ